MIEWADSIDRDCHKIMKTESKEDSRRRLLFSQNFSGCRKNMLAVVESGDLERSFGPRYSGEALRNLARQMNADVSELIPGSLNGNEERSASLSLSFSLLNEKGFELEIDKDEAPMTRAIKTDEVVLRLKNFVHAAVFGVFSEHIPVYKISSGSLPIDYQTELGCDPKGNCFEWFKNDARGVEAWVRVSDPTLPVTQEEYFHAAQGLTFGNVDGIEFLDPKIYEVSNHAAHSSNVLDRILSSAAAEMGASEFGYWSTRADEVTADFRRKFVRNRFVPWNRTPLGKEVNKRFRYPIVEYRELGAMLVNFSNDVEAFLYTEEGELIPENEALFNIVCLQFGTTHLDWVYRILDLTSTQIDSQEDFERIGAEMVEWGKKMLRFYKGKPEEKELVTHHTHLDRELDLVGDEYEIYTEIVRGINRDIKSKHMIPTASINLKNLAEVVYNRSLQTVKEIVDACFPDDPDTFVEPDAEILKKHGLNASTLARLIEEAEESYRGHMMAKRNDVSPKRSSDMWSFQVPALKFIKVVR